jgi:MFS family permease
VARSRLGPLAAFAGFGVFWGTWGVLLPDVKQQVDASVAELGAALLFISLGALPAMVVAGRLSDRLGARLVAPSLLLFAAAIVLPGLTHSVVWLGIALVAVGAASGALDVAINAAATAEEAASGARFIQIAHALFSAGFLVSALAVGLARQAGADPLPVLAGAAALLAGVAWLNVGLPRAPHRPERRRLTVSRRLLVLGVLCGVAFVVESGIENWSALFLQEELGASPAATGLGPGFFAVAMVIGRTAGQSLERPLGERRLFTAGAALAGVGLAIAATASALPVAVLGFFLGGAGISVAAPIAFGSAGRRADPGERGSAVASVTTVAYLGFLAGPPLIGGVSGAAGLRAGIGLLAVVAALLALATASLAGGALSLRRQQHLARGELS